MVSDARKRNDSGRLFWTAILGVLVITIIGLVVAIIIKAIGGDKPTEPLNYEATQEQIERAETMQEIRNTVANIDSWEVYIDKKIAEYKGKEEEMEVISIKGYRLIFEGRIAEALEILEGVDVDSLSEPNKIQYYAAMAETNRNAGNTVAEEKYTKLMEEARDKYFGENGGAGGN